MFRIRRIYDDVLPANKQSIREVQQIFAEQFAAAPPEDAANLEERLRNPFRSRFNTILHVAENARGRVLGFAIALHEPVIHFCWLDYIATAKGIVGRGVGAAIYEHVRDETLGLAASGLFFESLPDEPARCRDPKICRQNAARLRFYETYGARPIIGTEYEAPLPGGSADNTPHLMFDGLYREPVLALNPVPPPASYVRDVVRAVLERKYGNLCPPEYIRMVLDSIHDPIQLRPFRYLKPQVTPKPARIAPERVALVVNDRHHIHHVRDRGYVEAPVRISAISRELLATGLMEPLKVKEYPLKHIAAVHDRDLVAYLIRACRNAPEGKSVYPYVFPIRNPRRPPKDWSVRAGYYCIDTFTPINRNALPAARRAVDCALTMADEILAGRRLAYALVRPPGHHAERRSFGGFCYFNSNAVAAHRLSEFGKVAILDIDYHHGNGQQDIFYERSDVLTVSIHGDPEFAYPYFAGFSDERGAGAGEGYNVNIPLPESVDGVLYRKALSRAIRIVRDFRPAFLVVALGLDPAKGDPTGTWSLNAADFEANGRMIGEMGLPTLVVQEGGYRTRTLGTNCRSFFQGLVAGRASVDQRR